MSRRPILCVILMVVFGPGSLLYGQSASQAHPNIVVILADDLGYGDPGCYNRGSKIPTPNIDRLADEGMRFTDAHTPSSVCTPTRYGLLTGRYCWRSPLKTGVLYGYSPLLIEDGRWTLASMLKQRGYNTAIVGKWHLGLGWQKRSEGPSTKNANAKGNAKGLDEKSVDFARPVTNGPNTVGFDHSYIIAASLDMPPYAWIEDGKVVELPTVQDPGSKRAWSGGKGFWRPGPRAPSFKHDQVLPTITQRSTAYIDSRAKQGQPFFLYVPFNSPHTPWAPTDEFRGKTKVGAYGDFVLETDWAVGQILEALNRNGLADNTLVLFTSDNGSHWPPEQIKKYEHHANGDWRGQKADIWDAGHRVPFVVRWPHHVQPKSTSDQTVCLTDVMATCAAIVGIDLPKDAGEDSYNLLPILTGQVTQPVREATVHHSVNGTFAIRQGTWKLVPQNLGSGGFTKPAVVKPSAGGPQGQLYNLADDPAEQHNLWQEQPKITRKLQELLQRYRESGRSR